MEEKKFFLVLGEAELVTLEAALEGLVDVALLESNKAHAKLLLGIQVQCRNKRESKPAAKSWGTTFKEQLTGNGSGK